MSKKDCWRILGELFVCAFVGVAAAWVALAQYDYESLRNDLMEFCRDKMQDLYDKLKDEYNYLISDEAVWDFIVANDLCKRERENAA